MSRFLLFNVVLLSCGIVGAIEPQSPIPLKSQPSPCGLVAITTDHGTPLPDGALNIQPDGTPYRKSTSATIELSAEDVVSSYRSTAKKDGVMPQQGQAMLLMGNDYSKSIVITVGEKRYRMKTALGTPYPKGAVKYVINPGKYLITIRVPGQKPRLNPFRSKPAQLGVCW